MTDRFTPTRIAIALLLIASACVVCAQSAFAQPPGGAPETVREIYVPFEDLNILLEGQARRVFLTREEYDGLLARAKQTPSGEPAPQAALLLDARYEAEIVEQRVQLSGAITLDVLEEGLHALPLPMAGVGLRSASLDGQPAAVGIGDDGQATLFVSGVGRHQLVLQMVTPLQTSAAQQTISLRLPTPAATRLRPPRAASCATRAATVSPRVAPAD
jgi:hypothetical protein